MEKVSIIYDIETTALQPFDHDARITAIGIKTDSQEIIITHEDEKCILENFWGFLKQFDDFRLIGFNNFGFDSQWLIIRSFKHNIPIVEFSHKSVDLRYVLSNGKVTKGTLEDFSLLISNNGKHKGMKGSTAIELWRNNNIQELKEYLLNDVRMTYTIFQRLQSIGVL
ncbi:MAG: ribonuclease H-like domain-containing protein [Nanoarchaeota archaeon]